jgi:neutral ceramidase
MSQLLKIGIGKADITAFKKGVGMLGYGIATHVMRDIETQLFARAFVFEDETGKKACLVNCELCFITPAVKDGLIEKLTEYHKDWGYSHDNVLLSAQHTHCSPSGYSLHPLYSMGSPGFVKEIYDKIVNGIFEAIVSAEKKKAPAKIEIGRDAFSNDVPVSFNRSIEAFNLNPEIERKISFADRRLAADKTMTLLKFVAEDGTDLGSINWFAVHTTNLPNNFHSLCSDNKGFAADYMEKDFRHESKDYTAAFAQGACGDVSARVRFNPTLDRQRGYYEGVFADDLKSSKFNGSLQYHKAKEITKNTKDVTNGGVDYQLLYTNFGNIDIDPAFTNGKEGCVTSPSSMGVAFLVGSVMDGPGVVPVLGSIVKGLTKAVRFKEEVFTAAERKVAIERKYKAQGNKPILLETGIGRVCGMRPASLPLPDFADDMIRNLKFYDKVGILQEMPWTPQVLPIQLLKIGKVAILGFPFEITTVASWRLKKTLEDKLLGQGIDYVILAPYSNAYNGYIVTNEEYQLQMYEGGHCVFGQWALNALQEKTAKLAEGLLKKEPVHATIKEAEPEVFTQQFIEKFVHYEGAHYAQYRKREEKIYAKGKKIEERINQRGGSY